ncbi:MAG: trimethylamine methyltransferase family protein, partial [Pseudaminobacter sp.]|nr:trimethylamine methyltransferase family protein [Pseudaminobacter sp.]
MSTALEKSESASDIGADSRSRRSGGREARRAMRAAPLADDVRPIRPGLEGGRYKPLGQNDLERIHEAVLTLLETVGFANAIPSCIEACTRVGVIMGEDGRLRFPRELIMSTIRNAARHFTLHGQDPKHDMLVQGTRVHYGTAGAAVHLVDVEKREYRESLVQDIYDAARIVDGLDNIHFFQRPMVPRDIPDPFEMDFNTLYACVMGTSKHVGTSFTVRENVAPALEMLYAIAG